MTPHISSLYSWQYVGHLPHHDTAQSTAKSRLNDSSMLDVSQASFVLCAILLAHFHMLSDCISRSIETASSSFTFADRAIRCLGPAKLQSSQEMLSLAFNPVLRPFIAQQRFSVAAMSLLRESQRWNCTSLLPFRLCLDDDLTRQQMEGRRALDTRRLQLLAA